MSPTPTLSGRLPALLTLAVLGVLLLVVLAIATPWRPLAPPARGAVAVDVTRDFAAGEIAREEGFHRAIRPWQYLSLAAGLALAAVLGLTPLGARLVGAVAAPLGGGWIARVLAGALALSLLTWLIQLPAGARGESVLRRYGLSTQRWPAWFGDELKGLGISAGLLCLTLLALYALVRALPRTWWLPAAAAGALLVVMLSFLYPLLFEPVFNKFTPMQPSPLRTRLLDLARRDGVEVSDVLVADASRRTTTLNAYVSGFGGTRRIVVYDTALTGATEDEIELIAAHELGHAKRNDVLQGTLLGAAGLGAGVIVVYLVTSSPGLLRRAGVESLADPASTALVVALVTALGVVAGPVQQLVSRRIEARADVHALDLTGRPAEFARMQRRLALANLSDLDPNPLAYGLFASHPTSPERIALARTWAVARGMPEPPGLAPAPGAPPAR